MGTLLFGGGGESPAVYVSFIFVKPRGYLLPLEPRLPPPSLDQMLATSMVIAYVLKIGRRQQEGISNFHVYAGHIH